MLEEPVEIRVRTRRTSAGDGRADVALSAFCPQRQDAVSIETCSACEHSVEIRVAPGQVEPFVRCRARASREDAQPSGHRAELGARADADATQIWRIMTCDVACVTPDLSVEALTSLFLARNISGAPVVDETGRPIGIVSKTDLVRDQFDRGETTELEPDPPRRRRSELEPGSHVTTLTRATVRDVMMPASFSLQENASVARAAALMALEGVHRVPVVSAAGQVVGILSSLDVLRWLARRDGYIVPGKRRT